LLALACFIEEEKESLVNPIVIIAIVAQGFISRTNRMAGAIAGYVITTGILLWGISLYSAGSGIAFLGIPLSEGIFIVVCIAWYGFNTRAFLAARRLANRTVPIAEKQSGASSIL
jgi:hypothetical protein